MRSAIRLKARGVSEGAARGGVVNFACHLASGRRASPAAWRTLADASGFHGESAHTSSEGFSEVDQVVLVQVSQILGLAEYVVSLSRERLCFGLRCGFRGVGCEAGHQPERLRNSVVLARSFFAAVPSVSAGRVYSVQLSLRRVVSMSANEGSFLRRYQGRFGKVT